MLALSLADLRALLKARARVSLLRWASLLLGGVAYAQGLPVPAPQQNSIAVNENSRPALKPFRLAPTNVQYCYRRVAPTPASDQLVPCDNVQAVALYPLQDGMKSVTADSLSYAQVGKYPVTDCVQDQVTGLMWEGKQDSGHEPWPRAGEDGSSWYVDNLYTALSHPTPGQRGNSDAYSYHGDARPGDAIAYRNAVNQSRLCGFDDWRMPTVTELLSLVDFGKPMTAMSWPKGPRLDEQALVKTQWFPNTLPGNYMTGEPNTQTRIWCVSFRTGFVYGCNRVMREREQALYVRLVRGAEVQDTVSQRYEPIADDQGVKGAWIKDRYTQLVWNRCAEPQVWDGSRCTKKAQSYNYPDTLAYARQRAGWRMPNIKELASLFERNLQDDGLDRQIFPRDTEEDYWSSTTCGFKKEGTAAGAWAMGMEGNGYCESFWIMRLKLRMVRSDR